MSVFYVIKPISSGMNIPKGIHKMFLLGTFIKDVRFFFQFLEIPTY